MKKTILFLLCIALPNLLLACGCDMLIAYQGIMPSDYKATIGLNFRQRSYQGAASTHMHADGTMHEHGQMKQTLINYEINYRFFLTKKIILTGNLPIANNQLSSSSMASDYKNVGMADPFLLLKYELISPNNTDNKINKQRLLIGSGVKLPLGKSYSDISNNQVANENLLQLQTGSGSFDWMINANYQLRHKHIGLQGDVLYKKNFSNQLGYQKGNQLNTQVSYFYQKRWANYLLMPFIGSNLEVAALDKINKNTLDNTGGVNIYGNVGVEFYINKIALNFNYQQLIGQNLNGFQMKNKLRFNFGINYNLNFKSR